MPTTTPAPAPPRPRLHERRYEFVAILFAVLVGTALLARLDIALADPDRVDLAVENPTDFDVHVSVSGPDGGALLLGIVEADSVKPFSLVVDQGDRWTVSFAYAGVETTPVEVGRDDLLDGPVVVPDAVGPELRAAGVRPPPG